MAINSYYQDELTYLRELGEQFAQTNPGLSKFLATQGSDPDVERLFEGFAFLTGRIRQKLDDQLPEITHSLINLLWPNYLNPVPCMSMLEFTPYEYALTAKQTIKRHSAVDSVEVDKSKCTFRTCYDVDVYPIEITDAQVDLRTDGAVLDLDFELAPSVASDAIELDYLRLYLHCNNDRIKAQTLYLWLFNYLDAVDLSIHFAGKDKAYKVSLPTSCIKPVGFADNQALLPDDSKSFSGYRLLQEYFQLPEKFLFFDITELACLRQAKITKFTVRFKFNRQFEQQIKVKATDIRLYCTPIVNLFNGSADPIRYIPEQQDYMVRPKHKNIEQIDIFSVGDVTTRLKGNPNVIDYPAFESFEHEIQKSAGSTQTFHKITRKPSVLGEGLDTHITFVNAASQTIPLQAQTVSVDLVCSNRRLPEKLAIGDINCYTTTSPSIASFSNISHVTPALSPPLQGGLHWRLIANMALHYHSLNSIDAFRMLIHYYDFKAFTHRQAQRTNQQMMLGIEDIKVESIDRIIKGVPIRGLKTTLLMRESQFGSKGQQGEANMYQFACVLNGYFKQYAELNSFHLLEVIALDCGEHYVWESKRWQ